MSISQEMASPQYRGSFSGRIGGISATLSLLLFTLAALSARQALAIAQVLNNVPEARNRRTSGRLRVLI